MKKYCFQVGFENCSVGHVIADSWMEAIEIAQRERAEKYPATIKDETDIVDIKMLGDSVRETH